MSKLLHPTAIPVVKNIIAKIPDTTFRQQVAALFAGVLPAPSDAEVKANTPAPKAPEAAPVVAPVVKAVAAVVPTPEPVAKTVTAPVVLSKPLSKDEIKQIKKAVVNAGILSSLSADQAFGD